MLRTSIGKFLGYGLGKLNKQSKKMVWNSRQSISKHHRGDWGWRKGLFLGLALKMNSCTLLIQGRIHGTEVVFLVVGNWQQKGKGIKVTPLVKPIESVRTQEWNILENGHRIEEALQPWSTGIISQKIIDSLSLAYEADQGETTHR
jgi:hypothetical protein